MLVALLVLAMTVGLIRVEAAADLRVLVASGASSRVQRALTAVTGGSLAVAGALFGTLGAYLILAAGYLDDLRTLLPLPLGELASVLLVLPGSAAAVGWLAAGRAPNTLSRPVN
ncbi:MAG TPA: hypothetical protein VM143_03330 [Acidimicrobiales bacterium]|nr:hypothetical protein [Acidimicrobiales bacterium]